MTAWTPEDLSLFAETYALVLTAGDADRPGVEIGMAVVDGELYVRAYRGVRSRWYRAAREDGHGTIRVGSVSRDVLLATGGGLKPPAGLDAAFRAKYGAVADALVANPQARAATVRIDPAPQDRTTGPASPRRTRPNRASSSVQCRSAAAGS